MVVDNIYFASCSRFSVLGVLVLFISLSAILLNSIPLYSFLSWNWKESKTEEYHGFLKTIKVFITAVVCVDFCTMMLAIPSYMLLEFINYDCLDSWISDQGTFHTVCGAWATLYFGLKLSSLFLVAFGSYTTYLHTRKSDDFNTKQYFSCNTAADENDNTIQKNNDKKSSKCFSLLMLVLIGLFALSFFIGVQPLINIGPVHNMAINETIKTRNSYVCNLKSFARPQTEREYAFPFSLIMASGGCLVLLLFILVKRDTDTKISVTLDELKKLTSWQACVYLLTWSPLLVSHIFICLF